MKKPYDIFHHTYKDVCGDDFYGKEHRTTSLGIVFAEETEVKALVDHLNERNDSYYAKDKPEDEYDTTYSDEDYFAYEEIVALSPDEFKQKNRCWFKE